jgi:aryl-alcohol dehydrogenase-like predicted oxidoreductase
MRTRRLGSTGLRVSELGFGCASWWGKAAFDERQAAALVHEAIAGGVSLFDTGAAYSEGQAEPRLGRALKGRDTSDLIIATKVGTWFEGGRIVRDMSPVAVVASAERSLLRLGLDRLDILQLHGPAVAELTDDLLTALTELKTRGLVRAVGVNSFDPEVIAHAITLTPIDVVMVDYNVLRPEREALIGRARAWGKGVLAGMPLAMGHTRPIMARLKAPRDLWYAARGVVRHGEEMRLGARFRFLHDLEGFTGAQAALGFVLENPDVSAAVFGTTRIAHLRENLAASGRAYPAAVMARIRAAQM